MTNDETRVALAPYAESGREILEIAMTGGIDFTEAIRALDEILEFYVPTRDLLKPEAATATPGG